MAIQDNRAECITDLPLDVLLRIFAFLSCDDLLNCRLVCRYWYQLGTSRRLWKERLRSLLTNQSLCITTCPSSRPRSVESSNVAGWLSLFHDRPVSFYSRLLTYQSHFVDLQAPFDSTNRNSDNFYFNVIPRWWLNFNRLGQSEGDVRSPWHPLPNYAVLGDLFHHDYIGGEIRPIESNRMIDQLIGPTSARRISTPTFSIIEPGVSEVLINVDGYQQTSLFDTSMHLCHVVLKRGDSRGRSRSDATDDVIETRSISRPAVFTLSCPSNNDRLSSDFVEEISLPYEQARMPRDFNCIIKLISAPYYRAQQILRVNFTNPRVNTRPPPIDDNDRLTRVSYILANIKGVVYTILNNKSCCLTNDQLTCIEQDLTWLVSRVLKRTPFVILLLSQSDRLEDEVDQEDRSKSIDTVPTFVSLLQTIFSNAFHNNPWRIQTGLAGDRDPVIRGLLWLRANQ